VKLVIGKSDGSEVAIPEEAGGAWKPRRHVLRLTSPVCSKVG
jgi:hypothetical protein